jgi:hypothetical protein
MKAWMRREQAFIWFAARGEAASCRLVGPDADAAAPARPAGGVARQLGGIEKTPLQLATDAIHRAVAMVAERQRLRHGQQERLARLDGKRPA